MHREAEQSIEASGISYTHLRPSFFMQNFTGYNLQTIKNQGAFYMAIEDAKLSMIDVRDIAAVAVKVFHEDGHEGKVYNLTGPQALSNYRAVEILSRVLGREIRYVAITDEDSRKGMKDMGMPDWLVDAFIELNVAFRAGYGSKVFPAVEQITGNKAWTFEQFVQDYADLFN